MQMHKSFTDVLIHQATRFPNKTVFSYHDNQFNEVGRISFGELDERARSIGSVLSASSQKGDRALMIFTPGLAFIEAFMGAMYAGVIPVAVVPPVSMGGLHKVEKVVKDATPTFCLCDDLVGGFLSGNDEIKANFPLFSALNLISTPTLTERASSWDPIVVGESDLAFLQYTSGSTGDPKGVMVSHGNLIANEIGIQSKLKMHEETMQVGWLPQYHDFGLIGNTLQPIFSGSSCAMFSPMDFVMNPWLWLVAISKIGADVSGGPNFAYELCIKKVPDSLLPELDLSTWELAYNAAEPIRSGTLRRFAERFAPCGFNPKAMGPCYGLAENTLFTTATPPLEGAIHLDINKKALEEGIATQEGDDTERITLVGCGSMGGGGEVVIVDPEENQALPDGYVGEIWVRGGSRAQGYWKKPKLSQQVFEAALQDGRGGFLRTGDLGFLMDGELVMTGRLKDVLIVQGRNYYPHDLEFEGESLSNKIRPGRSVAFQKDEGAVESGVVLLCEFKGDEAEGQALADEIFHRVRSRCGITPDAVALLPPKSIPVTSSGKVRRRESKARFLSGRYKPIALKQVKGSESDVDASVPQGAEVETLIEILTRLTPLSRDSLDLRRPLGEQGVTSMEVASLSAEIERVFGITVTPMTIYAHPTVEKLGAYLAQGDEQSLSTPEEKALNHGPVAIIGMACRFPGGDTPETFFSNLEQGKDLVDEFPRTREALFSQERDEVCERGGFISAADEFDAGFFGISAGEASRMDPQQRLFLEVSWHAFENGGYPPEGLSGKPVGVFAGISTSDYMELAIRQGEEPSAYGLTGGAATMTANRLSYLLDIHGPSEVIDTACSSSLVAVHRAVRALHDGECEMAIAGGVNLLFSRGGFAYLSRMGVLSPTGVCRTFDEGADGYVRGEGAAAVLLKPLEQALEDGDPIYSVILGSASGHGGQTGSLTAPREGSQAAIISQALADAGIHASTLGYIEAHGTGTSLGDPIEINGLKQVFEGVGSQARCGLSSVKSNIGHLEAAAGIAGVVKASMALNRKMLAPSIHIRRANRLIDLKGTPFYLIRKAVNWRRRRGADGEMIPLRAGVSSFGFGGSYAHAVFEEAPPISRRRRSETAVPIFLSARGHKGLLQLVRGILESMDSMGRDLSSGALGISDIAYTLMERRHHYSHRMAFVVQSMAQLEKRLSLLAAGETEVSWVHQGVVHGGEKPQPFDAFSPEEMAALWVTGTPFKTSTFWKKGSVRCVALPGTPFERQRHWFDTAESEKPSDKEALPMMTGPDFAKRIAAWFKEEVAFYCGISVEEVDEETGFHTYGFDSVALIDMLDRLGKATGKEISSEALQQCENIKTLVAYLSTETSCEMPDYEADTQLYEEVAVEAGKRISEEGALEPEHIFMTGATGFLGVWTLWALLEKSQARITCLVRAENSEAARIRIAGVAERFHVPLQVDDSRISVMCGDLSRPYLGLEAEAFEELARDVDTLFHCGATVDWMKPYAALKKVNVSGTHEMIRLAFTHRKKRLHHVSSLAVLPLDPERTHYSEEDFPSPERLTNGYAQTKWAAEKLCREAMEMGLPVTIYRFDYVAGAKGVGAMKETDFIVRLIRGSIELGAIPEEETNFDILAADHLAETLVTLALDKSNIGLTCHLLNRKPFSTSDFGRVIRKHGYPVERLAFEKWVELMEEEKGNPLYPLTPFIKGFSSEEIKLYASWQIDNTHTLTSLSRSAPELITASPSAETVIDGVISWFVSEGDIAPPYLKKILSSQRRYWRERLEDLPEPSVLPRFTHGASAGEVSISLEKSVRERLTEVSKTLGQSEEAMMLTLFGLLVARATGRDESLVNAVVESGQQGHPIHLKGRGFPKCVPVAHRFSPETTLPSAAVSADHAICEAWAHLDIASEEIVELCPYSSSQMYELPYFLYEDGARKGFGAARRYETLFARSGLSLSVERFDGGMRLSFRACDGLIKGFLESLAEAYTSFLAQVLATPDMAFSNLQFSPPEGAVESPMETSPSYGALFLEVSRAHGKKVALESQEGDLSYHELAELSAVVAGQFKEAGVKCGDVVALNLSRSPLLVASLLAVDALGATLLPLDPDPDYPAERVAMMVVDSGASFWVTEEGKEPGPEGLIHIEVSAQSKAQPFEGSSAEPESPAYLIYTSGSTGTPKGVLVPHRALTHLLFAMKKRLELSSENRFLAQTTLTFDISFAEYLLPLITGGTLVLLPPEMAKDAFAASTFLGDRGVTHIQGTPSFFRMLGLAGWSPSAGMHIICGGEALPASLARPLFDSGAALWNVYGPTETTIWSTMGRVTDPAEITLGRALAGNSLHVLDPKMNPVIDGMEGDLWIGGPQVALGYHGQEALTRDRFIPSPFDVDGNRWIYRTGDRVVRRSDGELFFSGRIDNQLKIKGHRVEPGEIESVMEEVSWVAQAVVVLDDADVLRACVVAGDGAKDAVHLKERLANRLPAWMVPVSYHMVESLPMTANGKLDRKAIAPLLAQGTPQGEPPTTPGQKALAELWQEVIGVAPCCGDSFVELGGDSIGVIRLIALIRERLGVSVSVQSLFGHITLSAMAELIEFGGNRSDEVHQATFEAMIEDAALDEDWVLTGTASQVQDLSMSQHLLLTGATGYLGAYLVASLMEKTTAQIFCLVRADDDASAFVRVKRNLEGYGLWDDSMASRIRGVAGDLGQEKLGLGTRWKELCREVDAVIHNGAVVNFSYPYALLKGPNVKGTFEVLSFCADEVVKPLFYVSTISVFETVEPHHAHACTEHDPLPDPRGLYYGYSQSKWVAEHLVRQASSRGLPVTIFRPGPIYGHSKTGASNTGDFFTNMVRACSISGEVPMVNVMLDGAPVDYVASAIVGIAAQGGGGGDIFHLVSPDPVPLKHVVDFMASYGYTMNRLPFRRWLEKNSSWFKEDTHMSQLVPLLTEEGLTDQGKSFFELQIHDRPAYLCANTEAFLKPQGCPPLDETLFHTYLKYLEEKGFIGSPGN